MVGLPERSNPGRVQNICVRGAALSHRLVVGVSGTLKRSQSGNTTHRGRLGAKVAKELATVASIGDGMPVMYYARLQDDRFNMGDARIQIFLAAAGCGSTSRL